jgi:hypothetical protein
MWAVVDNDNNPQQVHLFNDRLEAEHFAWNNGISFRNVMLATLG